MIRLVLPVMMAGSVFMFFFVLQDFNQLASLNKPLVKIRTDSIIPKKLKLNSVATQDREMPIQQGVLSMDKERMSLINNIIDFIRKEDLLRENVRNRGPLTIILDSNGAKSELWHFETIARKGEMYLNLWNEKNRESVRAQLTFLMPIDDLHEHGDWNIQVSRFDSNSNDYDRFSAKVGANDLSESIITIFDRAQFEKQGVLGSVFADV